ncbi:MAG: hypothetical protein AABY68_05535 [Pseudomonadota bacterium]
MNIPLPCVAYATTTELQTQVFQLHQALQAGIRDDQSKLATRLIQDAAHELITIFFSELIVSLQSAGDLPAYRDGASMVSEIADKLTHYLGWASAFFSNERIKPAVSHYHAMMLQRPLDGSMQPVIAFAIPDALAQRLEKVLVPLSQGQAASAHEGIEALIEVIDLALHALLIKPKQLMKFNFVVDKTLNGVISLTQSLSFRSLRKIGEQMPAAHQPILAQHLQQFLLTASQAQAA